LQRERDVLALYREIMLGGSPKKDLLKVRLESLAEKRKGEKRNLPLQWYSRGAKFAFSAFVVQPPLHFLVKARSQVGRGKMAG